MTLPKKERKQVGTEGVFSSTMGHVRVMWAEESTHQKSKLQLALDTEPLFTRETHDLGATDIVPASEERDWLA